MRRPSIILSVVTVALFVGCAPLERSTIPSMQNQNSSVADQLRDPISVVRGYYNQPSAQTISFDENQPPYDPTEFLSKKTVQCLRDLLHSPTPDLIGPGEQYFDTCGMHDVGSGYFQGGLPIDMMSFTLVSQTASDAVVLVRVLDSRKNEISEPYPSFQYQLILDDGAWKIASSTRDAVSR